MDRSQTAQKVNYMVLNYGENWKNSTSAKENSYYYSALYGSRWIGHRVADCSGLFRWAFDQLGSAISHSSNRIWESYCTNKGQLMNGARKDDQALQPGTAVFVHPAGKNRTHIGLYVGDGIVIEASGTQAGVIKSSVTHKKWVEWGELKGVEYEGGDPPAPGQKPTLRKGDQGSYVTLAQTKLIQLEYDCGKTGADGKFGTKTEAAVKQFQKDSGLDPDGIIGQSTWDALEKEMSGETEKYTVTISGLTKKQAEGVCREWSGASMKKE